MPSIDVPSQGSLLRRHDDLSTISDSRELVVNSVGFVEFYANFCGAPGAAGASEDVVGGRFGTQQGVGWRCFRCSHVEGRDADRTLEAGSGASVGIGYQ